MPIALMNHYSNNLFRDNIAKIDNRISQVPEEKITPILPEI
jgi:hypothetical protein